ncbi:MAG: hypothetical protein NZO16_04605 [Deltaproteobacteria bacterium]|nr:hypothetical protein [Deltaproteobacteria bacterium]
MVMSCQCSEVYEEGWKYCPFCGKKIKSNFSAKTIAFLAVLFFVFSLTYAISTETLGSKPKLASASPESQLFSQFLKSGDERYLRKIIDNLQSKKPAELSNEERIILIDTFSALSNLYPNNSEIKFNLALLSFIFGAYSKANEILSSLVEAEPENLEATALHIINLTVLDQPNKARQVLVKSRLNEEQKNFLSAFIKYKSNELSKEEFEGYLRTYAGKDKFLIQSLSNSKIPANRGFSAVKWAYDHPVLGPKLQQHLIRDEILNLYAKDFPVESMPEEVRKKFEQSLVDVARENSLRGIKIYNNEELVVHVKTDD